MGRKDNTRACPINQALVHEALIQSGDETPDYGRAQPNKAEKHHLQHIYLCVYISSKAIGGNLIESILIWQFTAFDESVISKRRVECGR